MWNVLRFTHFQVALQRLYVGLKSFETCGRYAADGAGTLALEGLLDSDVTCRRQLLHLHAEVASRGSRLLLDV